MAWRFECQWKPTKLLEFGTMLDTSTNPARVMTDAGSAYLKAMGNRQGPHVLATDWVGTHLAKWLGLSTFDIAILQLDSDDVFELPHGESIKPGPAFVAREMPGEPWGRSGLQLNSLVNPEDITRMVVFDTWTLNCDRHHYDPTKRRPNFDNVFLSSEGVKAGKRRLIAMDHGLCFIHSGEDLSVKLNRMEKVQSAHVYGLFPEFRGKLQDAMIASCCTRLREMDEAVAMAMVNTVPREWDVPDSVRRAWGDLISRRAAYVAENMHEWIEQVAPWFGSTGE